MSQINLKTILRAGSGAALALALGACSGGLFGGGDGEKDTPTVGDRQPILSRIATGAEVDPALVGTPVLLPAAEANDVWGQAGGTASKSYGQLALAETPARAFTVNVEGAGERRRLGASPVIGAGKLFVVGTDGRVTAFDAQTGAALWNYQSDITDDTRASAFGGGVSFDNGRLFGTDGAGNVYALDADTGALQWKVKPGGPLRGSPTVAFGNVFVMSQDNQLFALDANDGALQWQESGSTTMAGVFGVAAPAAGQGTVVAGYTSGELIAYRYENGRSLWADALARTSISTQVGALSDIDADPIIHNGRVYALGQGGRMAAYELVTGQRLWELTVSGISTPAVAGDWVFALTDEGKLLAIRADTGKVRWLTQLPRYRNEEKKKNPIFWQGPVLAGGQLWAANSEGQIYRISTGEGSATLFYDLEEPVSLAPVVAQNTLYVLDDSGRVTAFR